MNHAQEKLRNEQIRILYEHGEHPTDIANAHFVDPNYIRTLAKKFNWTKPAVVKNSTLKVVDGRVGRMAITARYIEWKEKYESGMTLEQIGNEYGLSRERIRQVLKRYFDINREDGGCTMRIFRDSHNKIAKLKKLQDEITQKHFAKWGCSKEFIASVSDLPRSDVKHPIRKYVEQRRNATGLRNIGWEITFKEWWDVWQESGHWQERGRGKGYCMARLGDDGPYSKDNVEIITIGQNFSDSYITKPWAVRFPYAKRVAPNTVSFYATKGKYPSWQVMFHGKYIGSFKIRQ